MKPKLPSTNLYSRQYQRQLGITAGSLKQRKIPPGVDLMAMRRVMTVKEMATKLQCSKNCVYEWLRRARLAIAIHSHF